MKNYTLLVTSLFLLCQCASGDIVGPATLSHQAPATNQAQSTPTHFGGVENPAPDWGSCWQYDDQGNPISLEDCLRKRKEDGAKQGAATPTPEATQEPISTPSASPTPQIIEALLEPTNVEECQSRLKTLKELVAEMELAPTPEAETPIGPVIKLPPDFSKCLSRWKEEFQHYQELSGEDAVATPDPAP